jgi:hypothetical protein
MAKEILQITISKHKAPTSKFGKWFYWKIWFRVWYIWKPKVMSKIYKALSTVMLSMLPKAKREEILKELGEIEVHIVNKTNEEDDKMS